MGLWNLAVVVGVPGVGKTSLCKEASAACGYNYVNYGELMLEVAKEHELASTLNEVFKLSLDNQYDIWREAATRVATCRDVLLDLHGLDKSSQGYLISIPLEILKPDIIILVESSYENIIMRRIDDSNRVRPVEDLRSLSEEMGLLRTTMAVSSALFNSLFVILDNREFEESVDTLKSYL